MRCDYQYQFNPASQITQVAEMATTRNYGYDVVDRLTSATQTGQPSESYVYDGVGNRTASHRSPSYGYQPYNKLITTSTASYVYDSNGNMLRKTDSAGTWQYYWNAENQLVRVVKPGTGPLSYRTINYKYDALGRRVERQMKRGGTTAFTYDGQDVILDQKSDGTTTTYVNGPGIDNKLKQTSSVTGTHYYLQDHLGSTTALTNSSGNVSAQISYDAYGNSTSNALTRYGYTGRELDADTGLMYYRARWYDPQLGRFISEDPIGFAGADINLYDYVRNNPVKYFDPEGTQIRSDRNWNEGETNPATGRKLSNDFSQARNMWCALDGFNPWLTLEVGGGFHVLSAPGWNVSFGMMINPVTFEVCFYRKICARLGFGLFGGVGLKGGGMFGPSNGAGSARYSGGFAGDVAAPVGEGTMISRGRSGNLGTGGLGLGFGPTYGAGVSFGVDACHTSVTCFNSPKCPCN